jgi:hypothetical protein
MTHFTARTIIARHAGYATDLGLTGSDVPIAAVQAGRAVVIPGLPAHSSTGLFDLAISRDAARSSVGALTVDRREEVDAALTLLCGALVAHDVALACVQQSELVASNEGYSHHSCLDDDIEARRDFVALPRPSEDPLTTL